MTEGITHMTFNDLVEKTLSEKEVIIYLLVESGMTYREIEDRLGVGRTTIGKWYNSAKEKI